MPISPNVSASFLPASLLRCLGHLRVGRDVQHHNQGERHEKHHPGRGYPVGSDSFGIRTVDRQRQWQRQRQRRGRQRQRKRKRQHRRRQRQRERERQLRPRQRQRERQRQLG